MVDIDVVVLENGMEYALIDDVVYNDVKYILLSNLKNAKDSCIRKLSVLENEEYICKLDNDREFDIILQLFMKKNKTLFS